MSEGAQVPDALLAQLQPGETLAWWDRPVPGLAGKREVNGNTVFGVFMLLFMIFWLFTAVPANGMFLIFGLPFLAFAIWIVTVPYRAHRAAGSTLYGLTDRQALILSPGKVSAYPLGRIEFVEAEALESGFGHVLFFNEVLSGPIPTFGSHGQQVRKSGFIGIAEAERVAVALRSAIAAHVGHGARG